MGQKRDDDHREDALHFRIFYQFKHFYKSYAFGAASVLSQSLYLLTLQKMGSENQLGKVTQSYNAKQPQTQALNWLHQCW